MTSNSIIDILRGNRFLSCHIRFTPRTILFLAYFPATNRKFKPGFFQALKPITQKTTSRSSAMIVGLVKLFNVLAVEM